MTLLTKIKILFFIVGYLLITLAFSSVAFALDPNKALTQYVHEVWQDELPQNTIHSITQTKDGYIWLATYEGLVRFDGVSFYTFNKYNTEEIKSNNVFYLYTDHNGDLWIGTQEGILFFKDGKFTRYDTKTGLVNNLVRIIFEDKSGNIWIGTEGGISCLKDGKFIDTPIATFISKTRVNTIHQDKSGDFWFATGIGLVYAKNDKITLYTTKDGLSADIITTFYQDSSNNFWIGTANGLDCLKEGRFNHYYFGNLTFGKQVDSIIQDKDGSVWFGTISEGLWRIKNGEFSNFSSKDGLSQNGVRSIYEDREGNLWVGANSGLNRFKDSIFTNYTLKEGLSSNNTRTIYESSLGGFWIGTDGEGLNFLKDGKITTYTTKDGLSNDSIRTLCQDSQGNLWIGTYGGVNILKDGKIKPYFKDNLPITIINTIFVDKEDSIWIATYSQGVYLIKNNSVTAFTTKEGLNDDFVRSVYVDKQNNVWIGTRSGFNLLQQGKISSYRYHPVDGSTDFTVFGFYEDKENRLWIGTNKGLLWLKNDKLYACTVKEGLFDDVVFQILESDDENFWISCNKGIYKVAKKELINYEKGLVKSVNSVSYNKFDGMPANQCNGGTQPSAWKDTQGRLWFATIKGITMIDPLHSKINKLPPPVTLEKIIVNGKSINLEETLLDSDKKDFIFYYNALSFIAPKKVRFKCKLEGYDQDWKERTERTINYTNLSPGDYSFRVIACNNDGIWNQVGASYSFRIKTPFSQTRGAYLFYITASGAMIYAIFLVSVKTLKRRNRLLTEKVEIRTRELNNKNDELAEKIDELKSLVQLLQISEASALDAKSAAIESEKKALQASQAKTIFFSNMSHELRTPLNAILGFAQLMERDKTFNNKQIENLKIILKSGEHLLALINDVLSLAKIEAGKLTLNKQPFNLYQLLKNIEEMIKIKADSKALELVFELDKNLPENVLGDEGKLRQILINLLGNAIKFTDKGTVKLRASWKNDIASFEVEDTGQGISEDEIGNLFQAFAQTQSGHKSKEGTGLGLVLSKNFINLMDGEISVKSQLGKGTIFSFYVKLPLSKEAKNLIERRKVISLLAGQPKYKILVVDDEVENRKLLVKMLTPLGFEVNEAKDGKEAIEIWSNSRPNLIWMDIHMPIMDGYLAVKHIRKKEELEKLQKTVIIALTASVFEHEQKAIIEAGCDDFIAKPFYESSIFDRLTQHLGANFQYEEDLYKLSELENPKPTLTFTRFRLLPAELLQKLTEALNVGDNQAAELVIKEIATLDKDFADEIAKMVKNFQFDELLEILEGTLS